MGAMTPVPPRLFQDLRSGSRRALARAVTLVENQAPGFQELLHQVMEPGPRARRIGFTGPPGAGKSTLVSAVAKAALAAGEEVAVLAVDPTSPYSGGALLGDRIRMQELALDPHIFIRSMATRGSMGGLADATLEVLDLLDGFGFPRILVETVGVGQTELDIAGTADTTVVVLVPESGDGIQAMKAGLMEIADIFVVNKADRPGARTLARDLRGALHLRSSGGRDSGVTVPPGAGGGGESWEIPVLLTEGRSGEGVPDLLDALDRHARHLAASGELHGRRRVRAMDRTRRIVERELAARARSALSSPEVAARMDRILDGPETPYSVAGEVVQELLRQGREGEGPAPDLQHSGAPGHLQGAGSPPAGTECAPGGADGAKLER
jgi:LAO/AO transport system kinase